MDTVALTLALLQPYVLRRLYRAEKGNIQLNSNNLDSVMNVADNINANPENFALLSDITNFIQIGDLFVRQGLQLKLIEVKEGKRNVELIEIMKITSSNNGSFPCENADLNLSEKDKEQIKRMVRQNQVGKQIIEILNTDKGVDPVKNIPISLHNVDESEAYFVKELHNMEKLLKKEGGYVRCIIEGCLHFILTEAVANMEAELLLKVHAKAKHFYIADARGSMYTINKPLFMLPFSLGCKMDILFGRKRLVYLLDLDAFIKVVNEMGVPLTWATEKRTKRMQSKMGKDLFINNKCGLVYDGKIGDGNIAESWLLSGWLNKIFYEFVYPSSIGQSFAANLTNYKKDD